MPRVQLHFHRDGLVRRSRVFRHHPHHAAHRRRHEFVRIERDGGRVDEALARRALDDFFLAERFREPRAKALHRLVGQRFARSRLRRVREFDVGGIRGNDGLVLERAELPHHVVVRAVVKEKHLDAARLERFKIRTGLERGAVRSRQVINFFLRVLHALDVFGKARERSRVENRRLAAEQRRERVAVFEIRRDAFAQVVPEVSPKFGVGVRVFFRALFEAFDDALRQHAVQFLNQRRVLQRFAGNVQRNVRGIDDALHEAQPFREQVFRLRIDEHLAAVERNFRRRAPEAHRLGIVRREKQDGIDRQRRVRGKMQPVLRLVPGAALEFVEVLVFLLADFAFAFQPKRLHRVELFAVELQRERDVFRIALQHVLRLVFFGEILEFLLQPDHELRAARERLARRLDRVAAVPVARPAQRLALFAPRAREELHFLGDHEHGEKPDAELPDQVLVPAAVFLQFPQKFLRSRMRNRAEVFDELLARHPDAGIRDRQRSRLLVRRNVDFERALRLENAFFRQLRVAHFFQRVARVGNQLAQKNVFVLVNRVRDDVEHLLDFRLKSVRRGFFVAHSVSAKMQNPCQRPTHEARRNGARRREAPPRDGSVIRASARKCAAAAGWRASAGAP